MAKQMKQMHITIKYFIKFLLAGKSILCVFKSFQYIMALLDLNICSLCNCDFLTLYIPVHYFHIKDTMCMKKKKL